MKIQHLIPILFLAVFCTVSAQTTNTNTPSLADIQQVQSDADVRQKIVGTWEASMTNAYAWSKATITYSSNGCYAQEGFLNIHGKMMESDNTGAFWQINHGILILTLTNVVRSGTNISLIGRGPDFLTSYQKLIRIDDHEMVYNPLFIYPPNITNVLGVITNRRVK